MAAAKKKTTQFDFEAWGRECNSTRCHTCKDSPEVAAAIKSLLTMMVSGEVSLTLGRIHRMLKREMGYKPGYTALRNHVSTCESELWSQLKL
jgi:hypothetical protein